MTINFVRPAWVWLLFGGMLFYLLFVLVFHQSISELALGIWLGVTGIVGLWQK